MIQDLIKSAKEKDQKSQTRLTNLFWVDVFSFVMKKVRDENIADEITIGVFSKVLNKLDLYDPEFEFKTWLLMIAQNTIIDYWRKQRFCLSKKHLWRYKDTQRNRLRSF